MGHLLVGGQVLLFITRQGECCASPLMEWMIINIGEPAVAVVVNRPLLKLDHNA